MELWIILALVLGAIALALITRSRRGSDTANSSGGGGLRDLSRKPDMDDR